MTGYRSSKQIIAEIGASSLGGAFFILMALSLAGHTRLLTPPVYLALGLAGAGAAGAGLLLKADRRMLLLTLVFSAASFVGRGLIRSGSLPADAFRLAAALLMLLFTVWFHREELAMYLVVSGGLAGAGLAGLLTTHYIRVAHGVVLAGVIVAFILGKRTARSGDPTAAYRGMMLRVVAPCVLVFVSGLAGVTWLFDLLIAATGLAAIGWNHVADHQTPA